MDFSDIQHAPPASLEACPKVTVVTVVLNAVRDMERTLKSVLSQDYPNIEYVVVDGSSTDGTLELILQHRQHIAKVVSEPDGGVYEAMNKATTLASGEWLLFMNAGDLFVAPDVISRAFLDGKWRDCDVLYGDGVFSHDGYSLVERAPDQVTLKDGNGFSHQSTFVRTALQREFPFDVSERIAADYDFFLRVYKAKKVFRHVDVVVSEFCTGGLSSLPLLETIRLRHRVYKKHFRRSDLVLYFRLAMRWLLITGKRIVPENIWESLKRWRDRRKILSNGAS